MTRRQDSHQEQPQGSEQLRSLLRRPHREEAPEPRGGVGCEDVDETITPTGAEGAHLVGDVDDLAIGGVDLDFGPLHGSSSTSTPHLVRPVPGRDRTVGIHRARRRVRVILSRTSCPTRVRPWGATMRACSGAATDVRPRAGAGEVRGDLGGARRRPRCDGDREPRLHLAVRLRRSVPGGTPAARPARSSSPACVRCCSGSS